MQIDESRKLLLSDTLVPDIFITELMPALSGLAVKLYLYLLMTARNNRQVSEADLSRRMGTDLDTIKSANLELAQAGLLVIHDRSLEICDIKAAEIERTYRPRTSAPPTENGENSERFNKREQLMREIAKTFFQGLMAPSWYAEIENWSDRYHFEPEVIYALFQECGRRNKLNSKAYISRVAENWASRKIITHQDLSRYFMSYEKINKITSKVGRKLRKSMTDYDEEIVTRWVEQYGYDFDIIELALRKVVKLANPNLEFIDKIIQEWFSNQLKTAEQISGYEAQKAARLSGERGRSAASGGGISGSANGYSSTSRPRASVGNFDQRDYEANYFDSFYSDPDQSTDKSTDKSTDQPATQSADQSAAQSTEQPAIQSADQSAALPTRKLGGDV
ncbi:MAG: DnaD domain protein [Eubacteriales bacterium]|nr:DnaD domain protein [Eubacteriales bacterium]